MLTEMAANWRALEIRGALALLFGLAALMHPQLTPSGLALIFALYAAADGALCLALAARRRRRSRVFVALGMVGLVAASASAAAMRPGSLLVVVVIIGVWAVARGALECGAAVVLHREMRDEWLLALSGLLSMTFGIVMLIAPLRAGAQVVTAVGVYALCAGALLVMLALRLHETGTRPAPALE
jgi:uncharacterized membrane protein HdeD (DUF308 family)